MSYEHMEHRFFCFCILSAQYSAYVLSGIDGLLFFFLILIAVLHGF